MSVHIPVLYIQQLSASGGQAQGVISVCVRPCLIFPAGYRDAVYIITEFILHVPFHCAPGFLFQNDVLHRLIVRFAGYLHRLVIISVLGENQVGHVIGHFHGIVPDLRHGLCVVQA